MRINSYCLLIVCALTATVVVPARAQETPADYQAVLTTLGRTGDFKDGVLKVNIPRADLKVTIAQRPAPTPLGLAAGSR